MVYTASSDLSACFLYLFLLMQTVDEDVESVSNGIATYLFSNDSGKTK